MSYFSYFGSLPLFHEVHAVVVSLYFSFCSFYFQGLKKIEGEHQSSISTLKEHLFNTEKKRVETETVLRYKMFVHNV
jgi:hypothetical protein